MHYNNHYCQFISLLTLKGQHVYLFLIVRNEELGSSKVFYSELEGDIVLHSNTVCNKGLHGSVCLYIQMYCIISAETYQKRKGQESSVWKYLSIYLLVLQTYHEQHKPEIVKQHQCMFVRGYTIHVYLCVYTCIVYSQSLFC